MSDDTMPQTPALGLWPTELLEAILSNLSSTADLKQVRLVNKRFAEIAARRIFDEVHIALFLECIERLENISQSEKLAPLVKRLVYHGDLLPPYTSQNGWERSIDARPSLDSRLREIRRDGSLSLRLKDEKETKLQEEHDKIPRHSFTPQELTEHYARYCRLQRHQEHWGERSRKRLTAAVCRLKNLEGATVQRHQLGTSSARTMPVWGRMWDEIKQSPDNWTFRNSKYTREYEPQWAEDPTGALVQYTDWEGVVQTNDLLWAVSKRSENPENKPITSLGFYTPSVLFWQCIHINGLGWDEKRIDLYKPAFTHATKLHVEVDYDISDEGVQSIPGLLHPLLQAAEKLEELILSFQEINNSGPYALESWSDGLIPFHENQTRWTRLHTLELGICTTERHLTHLLEQHAPTLRNLILADCSLREGTGTWASLITKIPKMLKLDKIYFAGLYDSTFADRDYCLFEVPEGTEYEKEIIDYCLHGGDVVPHIDPRDWNAAHRHDGKKVRLHYGSPTLSEIEDDGSWGDIDDEDDVIDEDGDYAVGGDGDWVDEDSDDSLEFEQYDFDAPHPHHPTPGTMSALDVMGVAALLNLGGNPERAGFF
ncbi:hypothetical protein K490DRAFT_57099 [Saccharata proteae CBS 121410]|uniref:F-box domain-containing protein n=1 Tax=Saccharata proteae CBS 121410 TaxID=1314787 RepID=A0A9P4LYW3_9PEZI|nr:hypothetical protein K490DRAFT_57099 [Saccharata proteae CBS 121410]